MKNGIAAALAALTLLAATLPARAETIVVDDQVRLKESDVATPARGSSMKAVEARFGAPTSKHAAVGNPPITRWDYPGFSVFFEYDHVVHTVVTGS